jgi:hypothetical protein
MTQHDNTKQPCKASFAHNIRKSFFTITWQCSKDQISFQGQFTLE